MSNVLIFVDNREVASGILDYFAQYDCKVEKKMLLCGDYLVSDRVCIERKLTDDFVQSIIDKRLFEQLNALKENFEKPVLLIEGNTLYGRLHPNVIRGALASVALDYQIPIIWTKDAADTAGIIFWLAKREQIDERREVAVRGKRSNLSPEQEQEFLLSGLPDISIVRAKALLKHFKTPERIFKATEKELQNVENVGKKIAKKIRELLTRGYNG